MANETIKNPEKKERIYYLDMLIMLVLPAVMAWYYYGARALRLIAVCMLTGVVCEIAGAFFMKCYRCVSDCSSLFIGAAIALMLPADIPLWLAVSGTAFAIVAVKLPLGGTFSAPFVPAAAGFAFITLCSDKVFSYPVIGLNSSQVRGTSLASMLSLSTSIRPNTVNVFDVLIGNVPGAMGATCIIVLLGSAAYMIFRYPKAAINSAGFIIACAVIALLFPRTYSPRLISLLMELCSGLLIFAAIFLVTDPAVSPAKNSYRFFYGAMTGAFCMALRRFGKFEEGVCFAVLMANAVWPSIEKNLRNARKKRGKKQKQAMRSQTAAGKESAENV